MAKKVRLDRLLVERGLVPSRHQAQQRIESGDVLVDGLPVVKVAAQVDVARDVALKDGGEAWVGRGAHKLLSVIDAFGVDPSGLICADFGASTGGFTQVLRARGAAKVYAIDVGKAELHSRVANDPGVVVMNGVNVRHLEVLPDPIDLLVADLSFISLTKVFPAMARVLAPGGQAIVLVKPQFEVGRKALAPGGRVRSEEDRLQAIADVERDAASHGLEVCAKQDSGIAGAKSGNVEAFLHLRLHRPTRLS